MAKLQIFVQGQGMREIRVLELAPDATVRELVDAARAQGLPVTENGKEPAVAVYREDGEEPLTADATLDAAGLGHQSSVHLSRCKQVAVTVHYNGRDKARSFAPGVPMHRVKQWVVGKQGFDLAPVDAAEHVLQITGTSERADEDIHIGSLVHVPGCDVEFDLVAKVRVEG